MSRELWPRTVPFLELTLDAATELAAALPGRPKVAEVFPLPGGLTNSNYRLVFENGTSVEAKLYQSEPSPAPKERAVHRLGRECHLPLPHLLAGADDNPITHTPYALFEWVEGTRLDLAIRSFDVEKILQFAEPLGAALAQIHAVRFDSFGFFDAALNVRGDIDLKSSGMRTYFGDVLTSQLGRERLSPRLCDTLLAFAEREAQILDTWKGRPCLTHGDCGGTNILVRAQGDVLALAGIIDWEFSFVGTPFFDLGNLLRSPVGEVPGFPEALARGYGAGGGELPENWRALAALTDLLAWIESAMRGRASPEFLNSAQQSIIKTIAMWKL